MFAEKEHKNETKEKGKEVSKRTRSHDASRLVSTGIEAKLTRTWCSLTPRMTHPRSLRRIHMRHERWLSSLTSRSSEHLVSSRTWRVERVGSSCSSWLLLLLLRVGSRLTGPRRAEGRAVRGLAEMGLRRKKGGR